MINSKDLISVVMPIYNGGIYLKSAIESILNQSYSNFEFLILNDGSIDNTLEIVNEFNDSRIKLISNIENEGLISTLNKGFKLAKGKYIARMDADDLSLPNRFLKQYEFLENNPDIGICGTQVKLFGASKKKWIYPTNHHEVKAKLMFQSCIAHPSTMFRASILVQYNLSYDKRYIHAEDYQLWIQCLYVTNIANLNQCLYQYRIHQKSISSIHQSIQSENLDLIRETFVKTNFHFTKSQSELFNQLSNLKYLPTIKFIEEAEELLLKIIKVNNDLNFYNKLALEVTLTEKFYDVCNSNTALGKQVLKILRQSIFFNKINLKQKTKLISKSFFKI